MIASDLINEAYYLAGILDPEEEVAGYYLRVGLQSLNDMIAYFSNVGARITFFKEIIIPLQAAKFEYTISLLAGSDYLGAPINSIVASHILLNQIKFNLEEVFTEQDNVQNYQIASGVPATIYKVDSPSVTTIRLYPCPSQTMTLYINVKERMQEVTAFQQLLEIEERARLAFKYSLARLLANIYQYPISQDFKDQYTEVMDAWEMSNTRDLPANPDQGLGVLNNFFNWWSPTGQV